MKYQTCLVLEDIEEERILDPSFWYFLSVLWIQKPESEFHRPELIYDVLLPWLTGSEMKSRNGILLAESVLASSSPQDWRTPSRSQVCFARKKQKKERGIKRGIEREIWSLKAYEKIMNFYRFLVLDP